LTHPLFESALGAIAAFLFAVNLAAFFALLRGAFYFRGQSRGQRLNDSTLLLKSPSVPAVALLASVRDSGRASREFVRRLLEIHYGQHELILVLDGVSEDDIEVWRQEYRLTVSARVPQGLLPCSRVCGVYEPSDPIRMLVLQKERGDEGDALNAALNHARFPLIGILQQDVDFLPDVFLQIARPLLEDPERVIAACASSPVVHRGPLSEQIGTLEFLRCWLGRCGSLAQRNMFTPPPGCSMLLSRVALIEAGGFQGGLSDFFLRLRSRTKASPQRQRIVFVPDASAYPRERKTLSDLYSAARADQRALAGLFRWRRAAAPGVPSLFTMRVMRPAAETIAYVMLLAALPFGWVDRYLVALLLLCTVGMGILHSVAAVLFREIALFEGTEPRCLANLFLAAIPENLGYRQVRNLWLLAGLFRWRDSAFAAAE
jgi:hypothetical protein